MGGEVRIVSRDFPLFKKFSLDFGKNNATFCVKMGYPYKT